MSFILDALRKSETERQRGVVPGIAQVPFAAPRPALPKWAIAVIGALGLALAALAATWWATSRAPRSGVAGATAQLPLALPPAPVPSPSAATALEPAATARASTSGTPRVDPAVTALERAATGSGEPAAAQPDTALSATPRARSAEVPAATPAPVAAPDALAPDAASAASSNTRVPPSAPVLPSAAALAAEGIALPALTLELHVFHRDRPSDRLVIVNGKRYREGETLREGPRLEAIDPAGAVLSYQGRRFMLTPE
jgi:general secretion pathway protein B